MRIPLRQTAPFREGQAQSLFQWCAGLKPLLLLWGGALLVAVEVPEQLR